MSVLPMPGAPRRRILTPYVIIWMAAASFALAYLALLGLRPHMFAGATRNGPDIEQKLAQTRRDVERSLADLDPLRRTVGEVKMDVENLKVAAQEATVRDQVLMDKVSALESAAQATPARAAASPAPAAPAAPTARAGVPPTPTPNPAKATAAPGAPMKTSAAAPFMAPVGSAEEMRAHAAEPKSASAQVINQAAPQKSGAIETGSIERPATVAPAAKPADKTAAKASAKAAAKAPAKPQPVGVILATGPSIDSLRLNWTILTDRHADAVRDLHPRYVVNGKASNRTYGLIAGPVASASEAQNLCKVLEARGQSCTVGVYRGNAL